MKNNEEGSENNKDEAVKASWVKMMLTRMDNWRKRIILTDVEVAQEARQRYNSSTLLKAGWMDDDPSYYSGIPGRLQDLDGEKLMRMFYSLKEMRGDKTALDFVRMIQAMPSLACINVINAIHTFEGNNWIYDPKVVGVDTSKNPVSVDSEATLFGTLAGMRITDETTDIKAQFKTLLDASNIKVSEPQIIDV